MSQSKYDREFKEQVVQRIVRSETTTTDMAQELELHYTIVRDWVRQYKKDGSNAFPRSGNLKEEDADAKRAVFEYIELFYNRRRIHSKNGFIVPLKLKDLA